MYTMCMKLLNKTLNLFLNGGLTYEEFNSVKDSSSSSNRKMVKLYSIVACLVTGIMMALYSISEITKVNFYFYLGECCISLLIFLLATFVKCKHRMFNYVLEYSFLSTLLLFSILIGTIYLHDSKSVIYPALLLASVLFFIDRPIKLDLILTLSLAIYIPLELVYKSNKVFAEDLLNILVVYFVSFVLCLFVQKSKYANLMYEKKIALLGNIDTLTRLKNRNCFENDKEMFKKDKHTHCQIIYIDINGLHELNNTFGHDEGDKMLKVISDNIRDVFNCENSYRVGGDEFIIISFKENYDDLEMKIDMFNKIINEFNYYASVGYVTVDEHVKDFTKLIKEAETMMYKNKKEYYHETDRDIR